MRDVHGEFGLIKCAFVQHIACDFVSKSRGKLGDFLCLESGNPVFNTFSSPAVLVLSIENH